MKMHDVGSMPQPVSESSKRTKYYDSVSIDESDAPDLKGCTVGEEMKFLVSGRVKAIRSEKEGDKEKLVYQIEVRKVGFPDEDEALTSALNSRSRKSL